MKCDDHDKMYGELFDKLDSIDSKMDSVAATVQSFRVDLCRCEVMLESHVKNLFIHISKWWVMPSAAIMTAAAIAAVWK